MDQERHDNRLHLPDLFIDGFRGIEKISILRLGRVTLLAGRNSVGKTSVLDAVRVYAARGHYPVLSALLSDRDELTTIIDEDGDRVQFADFAAIFHGRDLSKRRLIAVGPASGNDQLKIEETTLSEKQEARLQKAFHGFISDGHIKALKIVFQGTERILPVFLPIRGSSLSRRPGRYPYWRLLNEDEPPLDIECLSLGPELLSNNEIARYWDTIALTDDEHRAVQALKLIIGNDVERVAAIGGDVPRFGRRVVVKLQSQSNPVPLKSLGDGAPRLFAVAIALANSRNGLLLIDEVENGIHHSVQRDFWRMVLETADENNVQVLATTHSYDCVRGFAQAVTECKGIDGALVRLERKDEELWAVEYSERNLRSLAKQPVGIEVR